MVWEAMHSATRDVKSPGAGAPRGPQSQRPLMYRRVRHAGVNSPTGEDGSADGIGTDSATLMRERHPCGAAVAAGASATPQSRGEV